MKHLTYIFLAGLIFLLVACGTSAEDIDATVDIYETPPQPEDPYLDDDNSVESNGATSTTTEDTVDLSSSNVDVPDGAPSDAQTEESVAEFRRQVELRKFGEIDVLDGAQSEVTGNVNSANGWKIIDGKGKTCAGIIAALEKHIKTDKESFVEVIIPDVLNSYDVIVWSEKAGHEILTQRQDADGSFRMLIKP